MSGYLFPTPGKTLRGLLDFAASQGKVFTEGEAAADIMLALDRDDVRPLRYYAKRWAWPKSRVHRKLSELKRTAAKYRDFETDLGQTGTRVGQTGTKSGQHKAKKGASGTRVGQTGTKVGQYRSEQNQNQIKTDASHLVEKKPADPRIKEVVDDLNSVVGSRFRASTTKTRQLIRARLRDGFTVDDFRAVHRRKAGEWLHTEHAKYLRPETLYGNKFEGYLNAPQPRSNGTTHNNPSAAYERISGAILSGLA